MLFWFDLFLYVYIYLFLFLISLFIFFFFKQKTAYEMRISDWSSDVCSSDLARPLLWRRRCHKPIKGGVIAQCVAAQRIILRHATGLHLAPGDRKSVV